MLFLIIAADYQLILGLQESVLLDSTTFTVGKSLVTIDKFTYGYMNLWVREYGEGVPLSIGKFCSIADNVIIFLGGNHRVDWITTYPFGHVYTEYLGAENIAECSTTKGGVTIGNDVWIGSFVTIMSGVTIGDGAVIAAHSLVVKDIEPYSIVGGNPAKHIRYRFDQDCLTLLQKLHWWDLPIEHIKELAPELCASCDVEKLQLLIKKYREDA